MMKIELSNLKGFWDNDTQEILNILGKRAQVKRGDEIPPESGGGGWLPYGLAIILMATGIVAKKFLEELGHDLYTNFKRCIIKHLNKENIYIILDKQRGKRVVFKIVPRELENGQREINSSYLKALDILPEALGKVDSLKMQSIINSFHSKVALVIFEYDIKNKEWRITDIYP